MQQTNQRVVHQISGATFDFLSSMKMTSHIVGLSIAMDMGCTILVPQIMAGHVAALRVCLVVSGRVHTTRM